MPRIKSISNPSASGRSGCAIAFGAVFLGVFVVVGSLTGFFMSAQPLYRIYVSRGWTPTACEVVSSRVVHSDDTARPDIVYRYTIGGRQYTANRYNFMPGTTSDKTVPAVVARLSPGTKFECYVDPADPTNAVIDRTPTIWYGMGLLFFLVFTGVPAGVAFGFVRSRRRARAAGQALSSAGTPMGAGGAASTAFTDSRFGSPSASLSADAGGPIVLQPTTSPLGKLIAILVICLVWNGIVGVFTFLEYRMFMDGDSFSWGLAIFLLLFQVIGLGLLAAVPYQLLAMANPRPIITLTRGTAPLGGTVSFTYELNGAAHRVSALKITLQGTESARYRRGTDTKTDTHVFFTETLVDATHQMNIPRGTGTIRVPADTMHSFEAENNKVIWQLHVVGEIARWPNIDDTFDITVRPS